MLQTKECTNEKSNLVPEEIQGWLIDRFKSIKEVAKPGFIVLFALGFLLARCSNSEGLYPFGIAFFTSSLICRKNSKPVVIGTVLGLLSLGLQPFALINLIAIMLFSIINFQNTVLKRGSVLLVSFVSSICTLVPGIFLSYLQGFLLYDILQSILLAVITFIMVPIFYSAHAAINIYDNGSHMSGGYGDLLPAEAAAGLPITVIIALQGLGPVEIMGVSLSTVLGLLTIVLSGYVYGPGIGAAAGIAMGVVAGFTGGTSPAAVGGAGLCGLLCGYMKLAGKPGPAVGLLIGNVLMSFFINGSVFPLFPMAETLTGILAYILIPSRILELNPDFCRSPDLTQRQQEDQSHRIKEWTVRRLNEFSRVFHDLAKTFNEMSTSTARLENQDIFMMFDQVAEKVCRKCSFCLRCWERDYYRTYQAMTRIGEVLEEKGILEVRDLPDYFSGICSKKEVLVNAINNNYEIYRLNMMWQNRVNESRELIGQQLEGMSDVIAGLAKELNFNLTFQENIERKLCRVLRKYGLKTESITVFRNRAGKYQVNITHYGCGGKRACRGNILRQISQQIGRNMVPVVRNCRYDTVEKKCTLQLVEGERFGVTTGIGRLTKYGSEVSGDSYSFLNTGDGRYFAVISDGMGSGTLAASQSQAVVDLLEQFTESGFDKDTSIRLINSVLMLRSGDENYATIDLVYIDLYSGDAEFVKIGAVPAYIKHPDGVEKIMSASVPAGILSNIEVEPLRKSLKAGDIIMLMSDGLTECESQSNGGDWVRELLEETDSSNPQEIADLLLEEVYRRQERPSDDVTVLAIKLWERI